LIEGLVHKCQSLKLKEFIGEENDGLVYRNLLQMKWISKPVAVRKNDSLSLVSANVKRTSKLGEICKNVLVESLYSHFSLLLFLCALAVTNSFLYLFFPRAHYNRKMFYQV
jgi:hypothetical protein